VRDYSAPFRTIGKVIAVAGPSVVYEAPNGFTSVAAIRITNVTAGAAVLGLSWLDASESLTFALLYNRSFAAGETYQVEIEGFQLNTGDQLIASATANAFHVVATVVEFPGRST
jgi:hypothetical protein